MNFRLAQLSDASSIAKLHVDSWHTAYAGIVPDEFLARFTYEKRQAAFARALEEKTEETYVLEDQDQIVGILTIGACRDEDLDPEQVGEIWGIYIAPEHWGCGYGRRLVREAERLLGGRGFQTIVLWVLADNTAARGFYQAVGFQPDGATKDITLARPLSVVRYSKTCLPANS